MNYYLLWAFGEDRPGIVSTITKVLFELRCNLEDSSMMRLGSEFAMFAIFTGPSIPTNKSFQKLEKQTGLTIDFKKISRGQAKFKPALRSTTIVRVHGQDQAGLVYKVTECLAKHRFNITDLSTHRTTQGKKAGYILLIEGELLKNSQEKSLRKDLMSLAKKLKTHISLETLRAVSL